MAKTIFALVIGCLFGLVWQGCAHQSNLPPGYTIDGNPVPVRLHVKEVRCGGWGEEKVCPHLSHDRARKAMQDAVTSSLPDKLRGKIVLDDKNDKPSGSHGEFFAIEVDWIRVGVGLLGAGIQMVMHATIENANGEILWKNMGDFGVQAFIGVTDPSQLVENNGILLYGGIQEAMEKQLSGRVWSVFLNDTDM